MGATDATGQPPLPVSVRALLWALAGLAVVAMVAVELVRPLGDPVQAADAMTFMAPEAIDRAVAFRGPLRWAAVASVLLRAGVAAGAIWWVWRHHRPDRPTPGSRWRRCGLAAVVGAAVWMVADLVRLPLQVWAWSRAVEVGLSTQGLPDWARDWVVQTVPYWVGVGLAVAGVAWAAERLPHLWVPVAGLLGGLVGVVLIVLSPAVFEPLLLSFTPLEEGELRQQIVAMVESEEGVRAEVLVGDASRRTTASNAYVSGLGTTRRIVLYDTLLVDAPDEEVLAIVAHELAHDRHHDIERTAVGLLGASVLLLGAVALLLQRFWPPGLPGPGGQVRPHTAALAVGMIILLLIALAPVERWSSRRAESAADARAIALTGDGAAYEAMMTGLAERNLSDPDPPTWFVGWFHSHPPVGERIGRARAMQP